MNLRTTAAALLAATAPLLLGGDAPRDSNEPWATATGSLHYFAVSVEDPDRSAAWYETAFGLRKLDDRSADDGSWRIVNLTNERLFVEIIHDKADKPAGNVRGIAKVGFGVDDVDAVADRVAKATGERPRVIAFEPHGVRILQLHDPDGNVVQLSSNIAKPGD